MMFAFILVHFDNLNRDGKQIKYAGKIGRNVYSEKVSPHILIVPVDVKNDLIRIRDRQ